MFVNSPYQRASDTKVHLARIPRSLASVGQGDFTDRNGENELFILSGKKFLGSRFSAGPVNQILTEFQSPVLLVQPTEDWKSRRPRFQNLLVCLDGSEASESILRFARYFAEAFNSTITLIAVPQMESDKKILRDYLQKVGEALRERGFTVKTTSDGTNPWQSIIETCLREDADIILMTTHGRGGTNRGGNVLGSVANKVVHFAPRPVFLSTFKIQEPVYPPSST
jgi:nucleotide-binding universal stress UspA family protein